MCRECGVWVWGVCVCVCVWVCMGWVGVCFNVCFIFKYVFALDISRYLERLKLKCGHVQNCYMLAIVK